MLGAALRRIVSGALAALCITCHAQVAPAPSRAEGEPGAASALGAAAADPAEPALFDPEIVRVPSETALARARALLLEGDNAGARSAAIAAIAGAAEHDRPVLHWIAGRAAARSGDAQAAAASFGAIPPEHPLAPWARLQRARALLPSDPTAAIEVLAGLETLDWSGRDEARALDALARAQAGEEGAEPRLRAAIEASSGATRAELERALAELLAARGEDEARAEALVLLRWIDARAPGSARAREALARADAILASLPEPRRRALAEPTIEQRLARAEALAAAMDHRGAEDAFAEAATRLRDDVRRRCEARLGQGRAMYRRRARREAAALLSRVADECRDQPEVRAWSRWYAAKSYSSQELAGEAISQYDVLAEESPEHRLADDALIAASRLAAERGDENGARARLLRIVDSMPGADMRGEARFLLAWRARRAGRLDEALAQLEAAIAEDPGESAEDVRGRAAYWRARVLEELGRSEDAAAAYEALARTLPLSYYAQQALLRLDALDPSRAAQCRPRGARAREVPPLRFPVRPELGTPAAARAIALLRAGEFALAERELQHAGLITDDASPEALWIGAALLDRAGAHARACELVRRFLRDLLLTEMPEGRALALWRIAYPRAFYPAIENAAGEAGVPPAFVRAIAREESCFRPDAVSVAHAYGLLQIIRPTAQRLARPLGLPSDPAALRTPDINLRLGALYVASLIRRYDPNPSLVPAAYNAGERAVDRWLRERSAHTLDEFIEEIPYEETRRYSRRVLQTWGIYRFLDEGTLPIWPSTLPVR
jgi:soluble lytic murein transglycosylase